MDKPIPSIVNLYGQTIQVQRIATTTSLAGYYEPEKKLITINTATLNREREITTLWHEVHHAIYDHAMIGQWIKADSHDYSAHEKEEIIVRLISQETLYMLQHNNLPVK